MTLKSLAIFLLMLSPIAAFSQDPTCSPAPVVVQSQQPQNENPIKIRKVDFTGNPVLSSAGQEEISAALSKATFTSYKSPQDVRNELKARVAQQWQQRGYFKVVVGEPEMRPDANDTSSLIATVRVDAGKQYRLAELRFVKNTVFPSEKLRAFFSIQSGDIFDTLLVGKGMEEIRKLYGAEGYINMAMLPTTEQHEDGDKVDLTMELDEGKQFRVGRVEVLGSDEAKRQQFISAAGLITGSIYNPLLLQNIFASDGKDGGESERNSVVRTINEADSTVDFKVALTPCVTVSKK